MFISKRNQVYPIIKTGSLMVEKHYTQSADWETETALYKQLQGWHGCAQLLAAEPGLTRTCWYAGGTLLDELLRQETAEFQAAPWAALAHWIPECLKRCGKLPEDGNLGNFIWSEGRIIGIDLESYIPQSSQECAARIIAQISLHDPLDTDTKKLACELLQKQLQVPGQLIDAARMHLLARRASFHTRTVSGIILAGGQSSRMGCDKSQLILGNETLLQRQIRKMKALGITDILISGPQAEADTRSVADIYPGRGPLGGLHTCLSAAENPICLVLSVDVPLVPLSILHRLRRVHQSGITVLAHGGFEEPLIGVYDRNLCDIIEPLIVKGSASIRSLSSRTSWTAFSYLGPDEYLRNCNTLQDYEAARMQLESFYSMGLDYL